MFLKTLFWVNKSFEKLRDCFDAREKMQTEDGIWSLLEMLLMMKKLLITGDVWWIDYNQSFGT